MPEPAIRQDVHRALVGRFGVGPGADVRLQAAHPAHPVWGRGESSIWQVWRDTGPPLYAVAHPRGLDVLACAHHLGLTTEDAWKIHVGEALLGAAEPLVRARVPRSLRLALQRQARTLLGIEEEERRATRHVRLVSPPFWWHSFYLFGSGCVATGLVQRGRDPVRFVVGDGPRCLETRPLPGPLLVALAIGVWWLDPRASGMRASGEVVAM